MLRRRPSSHLTEAWAAIRLPPRNFQRLPRPTSRELRQEAQQIAQSMWDALVSASLASVDHSGRCVPEMCKTASFPVVACFCSTSRLSHQVCTFVKSSPDSMLNARCPQSPHRSTDQQHLLHQSAGLVFTTVSLRWRQTSSTRAMLHSTECLPNCITQTICVSWYDTTVRAFVSLKHDIMRNSRVTCYTPRHSSRGRDSRQASSADALRLPHHRTALRMQRSGCCVSMSPAAALRQPPSRWTSCSAATTPAGWRQSRRSSHRRRPAAATRCQA